MRLIDADALIPNEVHTIIRLTATGEQTESVVYAEQIDNAPTVDAIEVVRCKECKWQSTVHDADDNSNYYMCGVHAQPTDPNAFCSYGERRSE